MRNFARVLLLGCTSPAAIFSLSAFGQPAQPTDQGPGLEEIVVTARRTQEKLQDIPVPVSVFTPRDLEERQIQKIDDFGNGIPNVNITYTQLSQPGTPFITIRGQANASQSLAQDNPVGEYIDGVYLASAIGDAFDLADLAQVEVLRGPQGTLFGKNTTAGALSLTTKSPSGVFDGHLETGFGDFNSKHLKLSFDLPEWNGFSIRLTGLHNEHDGYVKNLAPQRQITLPPPYGTITTQKDFGSEDTSGAMVAIRYTGIDNLTVDYKFDYTDAVDGVPPVQVIGFTPGGIEGLIQNIIVHPPAGSITVPIPGLNGTGYLSSLADFVASPGEDMVYGHSLTAQYDLYDDLTLKSISAYRQQRDYLGFANSGGAEAITTSPTGIPGFGSGAAGNIYCFSICNTQRRATHQISEEVQAIGHEEAFDWIAGVFYFDQQGSESNPAWFTSNIINNTITSWPLGLLGNAFFAGGGIETVDNQSLALYSHGTMHVNDVVDVSGGLRYTNDFRYYKGYSTSSAGALTGIGPLISNSISSRSFSNVDWDASVTWKILQGVNVYGKVSTAYLAGGILNGIPFDPVYTTNYEIGLKSEWLDHRIRVNVDAFHRVNKDNQGNFLYTGQPTAPVPVGTPFGTVILSNPLLTSHFNGLEIESAFVPLKGMTLGLNAGFESAPTVSGVLSTLPPENVGFNGTYDFPHFENDMYVSYRLDGTWVAKHNEGLSAALVATGTPALVSALTDQPVWKLDMRLSLIDIPLGPLHGKAAFWVKNLTDSHTLNYAVDVGTNIAGTYDLPRTYGIDLTFDY